MKVKHSDIKVTQLNNNCIMLISKFSRVLKAHDGTILRLSDTKVIKNLFLISKRTSNPELVQLASRLKHEIKIHLRGENVEELSFQVYEVARKGDSSNALEKANVGP